MFFSLLNNLRFYRVAWECARGLDICSLHSSNNDKIQQVHNNIVKVVALRSYNIISSFRQLYLNSFKFFFAIITKKRFPISILYRVLPHLTYRWTTMNSTVPQLSNQPFFFVLRSDDVYAHRIHSPNSEPVLLGNIS